MRSFVISTFALAAAVTLGPSAAFAQSQQQQQAQPQAQQPAAPEAPKLTFTTTAGMLLVQVKPGSPTAAAASAPAAGATAGTSGAAAPAQPAGPAQPFTASFEEMMGKIQSGVASSSDPSVAAYKGAIKYYKAAEPAGPCANCGTSSTDPTGNDTMYVVVFDPAKPGAEYQFLEILNKTLTEDQKRDPSTRTMFEKYANSIDKMNKLDLTAGGGSQ